MLRFKQFDWIFQVFLMVFSLLYFAVSRSSVLSEEFFSIYFIVGGWQMISVIIHFFLPAEAKSKRRMNYVIFTIVTIIATAIMIALEPAPIFSYLFFLLIWTGGLAFIYLWICFTETRNLKK
jgi:hypothetical protein